jgi:hypothetical protein
MSRASGVVVRRAMVDGEDSDELKQGRKEKLGEGEAAAAANRFDFRYVLVLYETCDVT